MATIRTELDERFAPHNMALPADISGELQSILRLHSISAQELFYKWESYSMKMGMEDNKMTLKMARDFKVDIQEALERESRGRIHVRTADKKGATPRTMRTGGGADVFGMMEGVSSPRTPMHGINGNSAKRKSDFETPTCKTHKAHSQSSPSEALGKGGIGEVSFSAAGLPFDERANAGQIVETLNGHIPQPDEASSAPPSESRIKLKANTDLNKFAYKPMAMKISEASEILDDRIDEFLDLVQSHHNLEDGAFGNPAVQSTSVMVAVGRIAADSTEGRLNASSVLLETSRRTGAGLRVPLRLDHVSRYELFPGKIVAVRGQNASGEYFAVSEMLELPLLPPAATLLTELDQINSRLFRTSADEAAAPPRPLSLILGSGPYTTDNDLSFEALHALCDRALATSADALILLGPFLDTEHPILATGAFPPFPPSMNIDPDTATLTDVFRAFVTAPLAQLVQSLPSITIIMVPSVRDAVSKHVSWPQDRLARKDFALPKQVSIVTNPVTISINELVLAISTQDILFDLRLEEHTGGADAGAAAAPQNLLARLSRNLIEQRHFYPLFPPAAPSSLPKLSAIDGVAPAQAPERRPTGAMLDISYLALAAWHAVRPDILITPSALAPFAKVVESVCVINPGQVMKRRGAGTFVQMTVEALKVTEQQRGKGEAVGHGVFERARVDVVRI